MSKRVKRQVVRLRKIKELCVRILCAWILSIFTGLVEFEFLHLNSEIELWRYNRLAFANFILFLGLFWILGSKGILLTRTEIFRLLTSKETQGQS